MIEREEIKHIRESIHNQLVDDILHRRINAGERLSEASLVERFGISRTPIREAFIQMEREGYIVLKKNVGAVVQKPSVKMVDEIFCIIAVLESHATEVVVAERKLKKLDFSKMEKMIKNMEKYSGERKYLEYRNHNQKFHGIFVEKLGNESLKKTVTDLRRRMYGQVSGGMTLPLHIERYLEWHRMIFDAVRNNDATKAAKSIKDHVMESRQFLINALSGES